LDALILDVEEDRHYYGISGRRADSQKIERDVIGVALAEKKLQHSQNTVVCSMSETACELDLRKNQLTFVSLSTFPKDCDT
jgi:hypothetical protein